MSHPAHQRLTREQREEMTRRVLGDETATAIAKEFGVTRSYVALLKAQALDPERFMRKQEAKLSRKLTPAEMGQFLDALATTTPEDHDLVPHTDWWTVDHGQQLAWKLFHKRLSVPVVRKCVASHARKRGDFRNTKPQPPKPHHIKQIPPDLAKDPDYVAYYLSPICEQIAWREYEMALADWNERIAAKEKELEFLEMEPQSVAPADLTDIAPPPGQRVGKHSKSKGSPFTPPKRRKKRR